MQRTVLFVAAIVLATYHSKIMDERDLEKLLRDNPHLKVKGGTNIERLARPVEKQPALGCMTESETICLILPFPPITNHLYTTDFKTKRRFKSKQYKEWLKLAVPALNRQKTRIMRGRIAVTMRVYRPRRIGDWDSVIKASMDVLQGYCFLDDKQIIEGHIYRFDDPHNPRVEIELREIF